MSDTVTSADRDRLWASGFAHGVDAALSIPPWRRKRLLRAVVEEAREAAETYYALLRAERGGL